jgi:hypothetical protein
MNKYKLFDLLFSPVTYLSCIYLRFIRRYSLNLFPVSERIFMNAGLLPVPDHYYQPLINPKKHLKDPLNKDRDLPGINWSTTKQLDLLSKFNYNDELNLLPLHERDVSGNKFYYNNSRFCSGDAEYYYNIIRHIKPRRIIEIGSGMSTLLALEAIEKNKQEDAAYHCEVICIEPYKNPWLGSLNVSFVKKKVEDVPSDLFQQLSVNDILFIDSSHIIRPQGDVLFEYLTLLPMIRSGVFIHAHDIFSPKDYPDTWVFNEHRMWNEQYLLESFLSFNRDYEIIGAVNFLYWNYKNELIAKCPILATQSGREPGSFWFRKL